MGSVEVNTAYEGSSEAVEYLALCCMLVDLQIYIHFLSFTTAYKHLS